jgi:hypothetical protein
MHVVGHLLAHLDSAHIIHGAVNRFNRMRTWFSRHL